MKTLIRITIILMAFLFQKSPLIGQQNDEPMNVLFIVVDDLKPTLGCYGDAKAITPEIDKIASKGTIMASNYCQQAICAPSRISLFTGMRPDYTGVKDLRTLMRDINPDIVTLPQYFKQNGYQTVGFGKLMHGAKGNDPESWTIPYKQNFELKYADGYVYPANGKYQSEGAQKAFKKAQSQKLSWRETNNLMKSKDVAPACEFLDVPDDAYTDGAIANAGIQYLNRFNKSGEKFFLALGFQKPHLPFVAPKKYFDLYEDTNFKVHPYQKKAKNSPDFAYSNWGELRNYSDIPQSGPLDESRQLELIRSYYACVSYIDTQIGKVYEHLEKLGMTENTIIVLWGDHGWHLGDHGLWCKHTNFEQATHAPLIFIDPRIEGGKISESMTEFVDVFPTICNLAQLNIPDGLHGKSLVPIMYNPSSTVKNYSISQYPRGEIMGYSLRNSRYRLTWWIKPTKESNQSYEIIAKELYDYKNDPMETISHASESGYAEIEEELSALLVDYLKTSESKN